MKVNTGIPLIMAGCLFMIAGCVSSSGAGKANPDGEGGLSRNEIKQGWKSLFDGRTLKGWKIYQDKTTDAWTVNNGTIQCDPEAGQNKTRADLMTVDQ